MTKELELLNIPCAFFYASADGDPITSLPITAQEAASAETPIFCIAQNRLNLVFGTGALEDFSDHQANLGFSVNGGFHFADDNYNCVSLLDLSGLSTTQLAIVTKLMALLLTYKTRTARPDKKRHLN